jgi:hypothetical protein
VGGNSTNALLTGTYNTIYGANSGSSYGGAESSNILIASPGVGSESNIARIGETGSGDGQITAMYLAGLVQSSNTTITTSNMVNGSGTINTTITSGTGNFSYNIGQNTEVAFTTLNVNGSIDSNVTTNSTLSVNVFTGTFPGIQTLSTNGAYIDYQAPNNLDIGCYKIEYYVFGGTMRPMLDITYKANGAGGYSNLRAGIDLYFPAADGNAVQLVDYVTVTTAGNPLNIQFTANGKNGSSSGYFVTVGQIRITKLG